LPPSKRLVISPGVKTRVSLVSDSSVMRTASHSRQLLNVNIDTCAFLKKTEDNLNQRQKHGEI
jgi:hypothetical protein